MTVYEERAACVAALVCVAEERGWRVETWTDPEEPDWPVVAIELPSGQVTWHFERADFDAHGLGRLPQVEPRWDGHSTDMKYRRLAECDWGSM